MAAGAAAAVAVLATGGVPRRLAAQPFARRAAAAPRLELRADAAFAERPTLLAGAGVAVDAGGPLRLALLGGAGTAARRDADGSSRWAPAGEIAVVGRFHVDASAQTARGLYVGGGGGVRLVAERAPAWLLLAVVGVEGRARGGWVPAIEAGVGGGVRVGAVLRRTRPGRR